ncbi:thioredoxin-like protein [Stipitochalara longipes BDJ]|nr:thioredoxin-like protein [Stipitochalara longipes BDJ]
MTTAVNKAKGLLGLTKPLRVGSTAPNFPPAKATTHEKFDFYKYIEDSWAILFSHPCDFTPVCTSEIAEFAKNEDEFKKRHVKLVGLAVGTVEKHNLWIEHIDHVLKVKYPDNLNLRVDFPIVADEKGEIAKTYNMLDKEISNFNTRDTDCKRDLHTIRSVFFIDSTKTIRVILSYPSAVGRSIPEIIRIIDALRTVSHHSVLTPCNWQPGDDVLVPDDLKTKQERQHPGVTTRYGLDYMRFKSLAKDRIPGYRTARTQVHEIDDGQDTPQGQTAATTSV